MGKYIGFIICIIASIGIFSLSLVKDSFHCTESICEIKSSISLANIQLSKTQFRPDQISQVHCQAQYQPARSGKKRFYILELKTEDKNYNLGSFKNYKQCMYSAGPIKAFITGKGKNVIYESGIGVTNAIGLLMGILMLVIAIVIVTSPPAKEEDDEWDEDT